MKGPAPATNQPASARGNAPINAPAIPKVLAGLDDEDSPYVVIDNGGGTVSIMDKDAFEYMYVPSEAPNPSQRDLDEVLAQVTRVRCLVGGTLRGKVIGREELLEITDPAAIKSLASAITINEDPAGFAHCMCLGGPTLALYSGQTELAVLSVHHGHSLRWKKWRHDAPLARGAELKDWLVRQGVDEELLNGIYSGGYALNLPLQAPTTPAQRQAQHLIRKAASLCDQSKTEDNPEALALCLQALNIDSKLPYAHALLANIQKARGQFDEAITAATTAIDLELRTAEVFVTRAIAADSLGNHEAALRDCNAAIAINSKSAAAWNSRGVIRGRLGNITGAVEDFQRAVQLNPGWAQPHLNHGVFLSAAGDAEGAIRSLGEALRIDPNFTEALMVLGNVHLDQGDFDLAIGEYSKIVDSKPDFHIARLKRGDALIRKQLIEEAIRDYQYVAERVPELSEALKRQVILVRAHDLHQRGYYRQVIELVNNHLHEFEDSSLLIHARASANWYLGELDDAVADFTNLLMSGGEHSRQGYCGRGQVYAELGREEEALADLETAVRLDREFNESEGLAYSLNGLGLALGGLGRFDEAFEAFSESLKLCPGNAWAYFNRAQVYRMSGEVDRAVQDFRRALKQDSPPLIERQRQAATAFIEKHSA